METGKKGSGRLALLVGFAVVALAIMPVMTAMAQAPPGPEPALSPPLRMLVVAAPRATLVGPARPTHSPGPVVGAAENFASRAARIVLREGTILEVRLSRNLEFVWHKRTHGTMSTRLMLQKLVETDEGPRWVNLGRDGVSDTRRGPSIGMANVAVRHRFLVPGTHRLRAIVMTTAMPRQLDGVAPLLLHTARDWDIIPITVLVREVPDESPADEDIPPDPDAAGTEALPRED